MTERRTNSLNDDTRWTNAKTTGPDHKKKGAELISINPVDFLFHIIWIITEADRSATTILSPSEY